VRRGAALIRLAHVTKRFDASSLAVDDVTFDVASGESVCLIGPSGCGKTTTLKLINRLHDATSGSIEVDGTDVQAIDPIQLRRGMGYVVQSGGLLPHLDVARNVSLLARVEGWPQSKITARVTELLERVQLDPRRYAERFPRELSGGQRQRVGVARALMLDPPVLLMDEPFGALDPLTRAELQDEFQELRASLDKTIVFVSHDLDEAFRLADRVALMQAGRVLQIGTLDEFERAPASEAVEHFFARHFHGV